MSAADLLRRIFGRCGVLGPHRFYPVGMYERCCRDCGLREETP